MTQAKLASVAAEIAKEKKAYNVSILDIRELSSFVDYFVVCHGNSVTQVQAIVTGIKNKFDKLGVEVHGVEGYQDARWVLIDLGDVIIHVFHRDERSFYDLERLWGDAKRISG